MSVLAPKAAEMGDPNYRTPETDPRQFHIDHSLEALRSDITEYVLDDEIPFYDKVYALDATLKGGISPYSANPTAEALHRAVGAPVLVKITPWNKRFTTLAIGQLDQERPWQFVDGSTIADHPAIDLQANFTAVRIISDTYIYERSSYGQSSMRQDTAPTILKPEVASFPVGLPLAPVGSERLYDKLANFAASLRVGALAIHTEVEQIQADKSQEKRLALHAAATLAVQEIMQS